MKKVFLFLIGFASLLTQGQVPVYLKNRNSDEPVPYANIWQSERIIASSDSLGVFYVKENNLNAAFKISAVGYKTIDSINIKNEKTIYLDNDIIRLKEVTISKKLNNKIFKIGTIKNGDVFICAEMNKDIARVGKYFAKDYNNTLYLDKIKFKSNCLEKNRIVSILLYSVGKDGEPFEILNSENIIYNLKKGYKINEVDISNLAIEFPSEGIFVMVDYLFLEQNKSFGEINKNWYFFDPLLDAIKTDSYIDTWNLDGSVWRKIETYSLSMQLLLSN
jgi:hypothetical protein